MRRPTQKQLDDWRETFQYSHEHGAQEFGGLWLAANSDAVNRARGMGVDASSPQMKALISRMILCGMRYGKRASGGREG